MDQNNKPPKSESVFRILKIIFLIVVLISFVPSVISGLKTSMSESLHPKTKVGYLALNNEITDSVFYIKKLEVFAKDPEIKALLLRIDTPGGYSGSCQMIFNEVKRFKARKPVVALIENIGASGAYYIACGAHTIIAGPMSLVGSIGNYLSLMPNVKGLLDSWKVHSTTVQSGTFKTAGSPMKDTSPEELAYFQSLSDDNYQQFVKDVAEHRNLKISDHKLWADGKVFTGNQAFALKLIDKLGSYTDAVEELRKLLKLPATEGISFVQPKTAQSFMRLLTGSDDDLDGVSFSMTTYLTKLVSKVYDGFVLQQSLKQIQPL